MNLQTLREQIDAIDEQIVALLNERSTLSIEVGKQKATEPHARYFAPERERDVIQRILDLHAGGPMPRSALIAVFREIISASIALQKPMTVAYWGPPGTFTQMAAMQRFGSSVAYHDCPSIPEVFDEVEHDHADYGVVPVENSTEGVVNNTLDMFHLTGLRICAEVYVDVTQNLLSHATSFDQIKRLYAFAQPLGQCRHWVDTHLPNVEVIQVMPTSKCAERAAADPEGAAIAAKKASEVYNIPILAAGIEDSPQNTTRFLVVGRNEPPPTGRDKTSVLFAVKNEPGSLGRALRVFEEHRVNLSMIASRPARNAAWEYVQFVDFQGHEADERVAGALKELQEQVIYVNVLGSYPEGL
ncbi:MAG: prephenate dehydratase [Capsulimonadaceae bacterium]